MRRSNVVSLLDRRLHEVAPFRPRAVVIPDVRVSEEVPRVDRDSIVRWSPKACLYEPLYSFHPNRLKVPTAVSRLGGDLRRFKPQLRSFISRTRGVGGRGAWSRSSNDRRSGT